jgi:hypothetical protein
VLGDPRHEAKSAEYTFVLTQYTDRWNMSCTASSRTNDEGSTWLGMRFGRG